jgi:putative NADH-flavin reductase
MRLFVLGASGRTGRRVLVESLRRGVTVVAHVRDASRLGELANRVTVVSGDVRDAAALESALSKEDAVISTLGGEGVAHGAVSVVAAMNAVGATRVLALVGAGILDGPGGTMRNRSPDYPARFRQITVHHEAALDAYRASPLSWVVVGAPRIVDAEPTGRLRTALNTLPDGTGEVTTGDVAELLVREAMITTLSRTRVGINSAP